MGVRVTAVRRLTTRRAGVHVVREELLISESDCPECGGGGVDCTACDRCGKAPRADVARRVDALLGLAEALYEAHSDAHREVNRAVERFDFDEVCTIEVRSWVAVARAAQAMGAHHG